jgi:hypothetical protein
MATRWMHLWITLFVMHVFVIANSRAQTPNSSLLVETEHGQKTFHVGERIPLHLTFFDSEGQPYLVDHEPCGDRYCGVFRKPERFEVQPATGWSDPLATYFAGDFIMTGGGPPPQPPTKPLQVRLDLNEWVRFDEPGDYMVKITSGRVADAFVSGAIDLHIVPASLEWQDAKLQWIRENWGFEHAAFGAAQADLRYLGTPAAVEEMTSRLREEINPGIADYQCSPCMGIMGLSGAMREVAVASMNRRIEESDFPISQAFLRTMFFLHVPPGTNIRTILRPIEPYDTVLWLKVLSALPKKDSAARAQTVQTLLEAGQYINTPEVQRWMRSLPRGSIPGSDPASR